MSGRNKVLFLIAILALIGLAFFVRVGEAQPKTGKNSPAKPVFGAPISVRAVAFAETKPARELAAQDALMDTQFKGEGEEINELNLRFIRRPNPYAPQQRDGALQTSFGIDGRLKLNIPAPLLTFEGIGVQNSAPPDTTGAVGPNDYVQTVNSLVRVWDKNGVPRGPAFKLSSLFAPLGGVLAAGDQGDQIVLYDRMANRWLIAQFAFASQTAPPFHQGIAISKTGDPTGAYWVYDFITPGSEFPDYPKFGAWPDAYYYTDRQFTAPGLSYNGFGCFAFDRAKMLVGDPTAAFIYFNAGPSLSNASSGMIPSDFNGLTPPPAGAPNVFVVMTDDAFAGDTADTLRMFNFHADFVTPGNSTFTERPESPLAVAAFDSRSPGSFNNARAEIEEPAPAVATDYLNAISDRLMLRLQYLNLAGTEMLTTVHTVNAGTIPAPGVAPTVAQYRAATRHYILQKTTPGGAYSVLDQATFSPDTVERWMGSSALDNAGNLAVGYSTSNTSVFPSIGYVGRLATDLPNTLSGEQTMFAGTAVQQVTGNRWGDYSAMCLDPSDDATFWFTSEYYLTTGQFLWHTRVGNFKFAGTVAPPQGTLSGTVTACDTGALLKDALVQVSGGPSTGFSSATKPDGTYSMNLSPGSYSVTISDPAHLCTAIGPFPVNITNGNTTTQNGCLSGAATFLFQSSLISLSGGDGDGVIEPNECNNLNVTILNNGCLLGSNVSAVLSSSTPGVTITQPNSPYPNTNESAASVNAVPFRVSTDNTIVCGTTINFTLTVTFTGGTSTFSFSLPTCNVPPTVVSGALTAGDLQQPVGRLGRNGVVSLCGTAKACPGPLGAGPRLYDLLTFTNGPGAACVTIATTQSCPTPANDIIPAAYLGSYDPTNFCTNYLGDPGGSPGATGNSFSVNLAANATLVVVIQEANAGLAGCSGYQVTVSGLVGSGTGPGPCAPAPTVVSEKVHGGAGTFPIPMPLTGTSGVEDRRGNGGVAGEHTIRLSFTTDPTGATASVIARTAGVGGGVPAGTVGGVSYSGNDMIVNLTGVSNAQLLTLSTSGGSVSPAVVPIGFLRGDTNASRSLSASDVAQTKNAISHLLDGTNFRTDINVNGTTNAGDVAEVKASFGTSLP